MTNQAMTNHGTKNHDLEDIAFIVKGLAHAAQGGDLMVIEITQTRDQLGTDPGQWRTTIQIGARYGPMGMHLMTAHISWNSRNNQVRTTGIDGDRFDSAALLSPMPRLISEYPEAYEHLETIRAAALDLAGYAPESDS